MYIRQLPLPLRRNKRTLYYDAHPVIIILANELQERRRPSWLGYLQYYSGRAFGRRFILTILFTYNI